MKYSSNGIKNKSRSFSNYVRVVLLGALCAPLLGSLAIAEELRYQPTNPAFGGNPFNGPYFLGNATAQRQYDAPRRRRDSLADFSESIKASILSRISRQIADSILGENAKDSGTFSIGDTFVDFERTGDQVTVNIKDETTGGSTTIQIPVP